MIAAIYARTIFVMLWGLLAAVTSASAECAWVLWSRYEFVNVTPGKPYETQGWTIVAEGFDLLLGGDINDHTIVRPSLSRRGVPRVALVFPNESR
jgi:hypothetical protein